MKGGSSAEPRPVPSAPLTAVVHDAVRRWFVETQKEALKGDVVSLPACVLLLLALICSCMRGGRSNCVIGSLAVGSGLCMCTVLMPES